MAFCGIGNPEPFKTWLLDSGAVVKGMLIFDDHHEYTGKDLECIMDARQEWNAEVVLTTEKDIIKIGGHDTDLGILALRMELTPQKENSGALIFETINHRIHHGKQ
jgi:tetraacyldisaccharide 4'-kinase